jgi:hypothetical protein
LARTTRASEHFPLTPVDVNKLTVTAATTGHGPPGGNRQTAARIAFRLKPILQAI